MTPGTAQMRRTYWRGVALYVQMVLRRIAADARFRP